MLLYSVWGNTAGNTAHSAHSALSALPAPSGWQELSSEPSRGGPLHVVPVTRAHAIPSCGHDVARRVHANTQSRHRSETRIMGVKWDRRALFYRIRPGP